MVFREETNDAVYLKKNKKKTKQKQRNENESYSIYPSVIEFYKGKGRKILRKIKMMFRSLKLRDREDLSVSRKVEQRSDPSNQCD